MKECLARSLRIFGNLVINFGGRVFSELQRDMEVRGADPGVAFRALTTAARLNYSTIANDRRNFFEWALSGPMNQKSDTVPPSLLPRHETSRC